MSFSRPVIAFALLKQSGEAISGDLLSGITILIRPIVGDLSGRIFDSRILSERLAQFYGMDCPVSVLEDFVPRLVVADILVIDDSQTPHRYIYAEQNPDNKAAEIDPEEERQIQAVIDAFVNHAKAQIADRFEISDDALISGFLRHLSTMDFSAARNRPIVAPAQNDRLLEGPTARSLRALSESLATEAVIDMVVASHISNLEGNDPHSLELMANIADGALAAELVLDLRAPTSVTRFTESVAIIDTPTLLSYLNLSSSHDTEAAIALLTQLQASGARIAAFSHSIEEAEGILSAIQLARHSDTGAYGRTAARMASSATYRAYVESMIGRIGSYWTEKHGFEVIQATANQFYVNFTADAEERLFESLRPTYGDKVPQGLKDAKSVAETLRRLGGAHIPIDKAQSCKYFFVTDNIAYQQISERFLKHNNYVRRGEFVPVVTDRYMTGLCWLIFGGTTEFAPSRVKLLANCAAALRTRPEVVERTKQFLQQLQPSLIGHFEALMTNDRASQYLMGTSLGNPDAITANNVMDVFHGMQEKLIERVVKEKDEVLAKTVAEYQAKLVNGDVAVAELREKLTTTALDKAAAAFEAQQLRKQTASLAEQAKAKDGVVATQSETLQQLTKDVGRLSASESEAKSKLAAHRLRAEQSAMAYTRKCMFGVKFIGAVFPIVGVVLVSFYDKFLLEHIPEEFRAAGNWGFIIMQALLIISCTGFLMDLIFAKRLEILQEGIYSRRLLMLGFDSKERPESGEPN